MTNINNTSGNRNVDDSEETVARLIHLARETFGDERLGATEQAGLVRFERSVARRTLRRRGSGLRWAFGLGLAAAACVFSFMTFHDRRPALTFSVVNGTVSNGGYVRANVSSGTALHFSDGSSVALDPGTGARVGDFDADGGRVLIESGRARVHVTPRPRASWTVDAGPYSVHVIGTEFDIRWLASEEVLDVHLLKGAIVVRGPLATEGLAMQTGAHLFANVRKGEIRLDEQGASGGTAEGVLAPPPREAPAPTGAEAGDGRATHAVAVQAAASAQPGRGHASTAVSNLRASDRETDWKGRLARGDFQGVLVDAQHRGLEAVFTTASPADLTVLADAARFARRVDIARGALLAERARYPHSAQGREAAFFLGGLTEDESGEASKKAALDWYNVYLRESPNGAFARPVLGRKMVLVQKLLGPAAARPIAVEYLERFSDGPYAGSARKLVEPR
jgi:hypothetical protein